MKRTLTALTIAVSLIASGASAFELNTTQTEENRIAGKRMVGDLTVGVKALIASYSSYNCRLDGKMHLISYTEIETELNDYVEYYRIQLEADGEFTMTYVPAEKGDKEFPSFPDNKCSDISDLHPDATFIPVKSINGFTDRRSLFVDLINQGYE
jgi:hypothetical protein